jgi:hypothetical protein
MDHSHRIKNQKGWKLILEIDSVAANNKVKGKVILVIGCGGLWDPRKGPIGL